MDKNMLIIAFLTPQRSWSCCCYLSESTSTNLIKPFMTDCISQYKNLQIQKSPFIAHIPIFIRLYTPPISSPFPIIPKSWNQSAMLSGIQSSAKSPLLSTSTSLRAPCTILFNLKRVSCEADASLQLTQEKLLFTPQPPNPWTQGFSRCSRSPLPL